MNFSFFHATDAARIAQKVARTVPAAVLGAMLSLLLWIAAPASAWADAYPSKLVRLVAPYPAGGATDVAARLLAAEMSTRLGQQVIVENRPGVAGVIGAEYVSKQPADGYTLLFGGAGNITLRPLMDSKMTLKPERDLVPVNHVVTYDHLLVVRPSLGVNSVADLIKLAKANPGKLNFGSSGSGGPQHMAMELFKAMAGVDITHVPYKGEAPVVTDMLGERIDMSIISTTAVNSFVKAGKLKALATTNPYRSPTFPDLPMVSEAGVKGYEVEAYGGVMVPAGTPRAVIDRLNQVISEAVQSPALTQKFHDNSLLPIGRGPAEFSAFLAKERKKWDPIIKTSNIVLD